jgi:hypothetical protein
MMQLLSILFQSRLVPGQETAKPEWLEDFTKDGHTFNTVITFPARCTSAEHYMVAWL